MIKIEKQANSILSQVSAERSRGNELQQISLMRSTLWHNARQDALLYPKDDGWTLTPFYITSFLNDLRTSNPEVTINLRRKVPLNDVLYDFIESYTAMNIDGPQLCTYDDKLREIRNWERYEQGNYLDEDLPNHLRKQFEEEDKFYFTNDGNSIEEYEKLRAGDTPNGKVYYYAESNGRKITIHPTNELLGSFRPVVVLEAYLLHVLDRQRFNLRKF